MKRSRAAFLASSVAGAALAPFTASPVRAAARENPSARIDALLDGLPGTAGAVIYAADESFAYARNPNRALVVGSCFKVFVAAEIHRMVEAGHCSLDEMLPLNESVYVPGSTAFTPKLHGEVPVRVALQEMIAYSDNAATDMLMKRAGVANVRAFIASTGLKTIQIPDSARALFSYLGGLPKGQVATYRQLYELDPPPAGLKDRSADNDVVTSKVSPQDLATFYQRAVRGDYFKKAQTLDDFLVTMSTGSGLAEQAIPHGSAAYMKGGSIEGQLEAICVGGAMVTLDKTLYFAIGVNWPASKAEPFSKIEARFMPVHKQIMALARATQFS